MCMQLCMCFFSKKNVYTIIFKIIFISLCKKFSFVEIKMGNVKKCIDRAFSHIYEGRTGRQKAGIKT